MSTTEVESIKETLSEHGELLHRVLDTQNNMMHLFRGNPLNQSDTGLLGRVDAMERKVESLLTLRDRVLWTVGGVVLVVGAIWSIAQVFIK